MSIPFNSATCLGGTYAKERILQKERDVLKNGHRHLQSKDLNSQASSLPLHLMELSILWHTRQQENIIKVTIKVEKTLIL